ncbi:hypothetical protein C0Q16_29655, partial [Klebsiella pneumoniae]
KIQRLRFSSGDSWAWKQVPTGRPAMAWPMNVRTVAGEDPALTVLQRRLLGVEAGTYRQACHGMADERP